jgi:hypothetical protein
MGSYICCFTLLDDKDNIIDNFEPITGISSGLSKWSDDSNYFIVAVDGAVKGYSTLWGYLIIKFPERTFSFIKISNPYPLELQFRNENVIISYEEKQVVLSNSAQTIGDGISQTPKRKYLKPDDLSFNLNDLKFYPRENLGNLETYFQNETNYDLKLIADGFFEFKGTLPQNTEHLYHNKPISVYQLKEFADYGDEVAKEWLEEIKQKTNNNYNHWYKVSYYIGYQKRPTNLKKWWSLGK